jgi:hypothetical protein
VNRVNFSSRFSQIIHAVCVDQQQASKPIVIFEKIKKLKKKMQFVDNKSNGSNDQQEQAIHLFDLPEDIIKFEILDKLLFSYLRILSCVSKKFAQYSKEIKQLHISQKKIDTISEDWKIVENDLVQLGKAEVFLTNFIEYIPPKGTE